MTETAKVAGLFDRLGRSITQHGRSGDHLEWSAQEYMAQAMGHISQLSALVGRTMAASRTGPLRSRPISVPSKCPRLIGMRL